MADLSESYIKGEIERLGKKQEWNHLFTLGNIQTREPGTSPGDNVEKWDRLHPVLEKIGLNGKTVIDVGCSEGFFSFEAAKLGADVLGVDLDEVRIEKAQFVKRVLQIDSVSFESLGIYDPKIKEKSFDISFALGFLHRVPEIYRALEVLTDISNVVVLEFKTLDSDQPVCQWTGGEVKQNKLNKLYFIPSVSFIEGILSDFGFKTLYLERDDESQMKYKRTVLLSSKNEAAI